MISDTVCRPRATRLAVVFDEGDVSLVLLNERVVGSARFSSAAFCERTVMTISSHGSASCSSATLPTTSSNVSQSVEKVVAAARKPERTRFRLSDMTLLSALLRFTENHGRSSLAPWFSVHSVPPKTRSRGALTAFGSATLHRKYGRTQCSLLSAHSVPPKALIHG